MSTDNNNSGTTGTPNKTRVVKVQGNTVPQQTGNVTNTDAGNSPEVPVVKPNTVAPPSSPSTTTTTSAPSGTVTAAGGQEDPEDINIGKFISESTAEIRTGEEKESERKKKTDYLTKALESINKFERIVFSNSETQEFIGTKMQYVKDGDGKTVYDYMNDPVVTEHIEFIVPEDDPQDGSPVDRHVSFFWKKPTF